MDPNENRKECGAISGTDYLSAAEQTWYLENCLVVITQDPPLPLPPASPPIFDLGITEPPTQSLITPPETGNGGLLDSESSPLGTGFILMGTGVLLYVLGLKTMFKPATFPSTTPVDPRAGMKQEATGGEGPVKFLSYHAGEGVPAKAQAKASIKRLSFPVGVQSIEVLGPDIFTNRSGREVFGAQVRYRQRRANDRWKTRIVELPKGVSDVRLDARGDVPVS